MRALHETDARTIFSAVLDAAGEDNDQVVITRGGGREPVVVISLREWEAMTETAYLLSNPANAAWLAQGIAQAEAGQVTVRELIDPDAGADEDDR
ncbi:type II toxin-antitoxin system Phd/YefM family antitoxin [Nocardia cyriacigeorgica]|uniref:type II toxin-antitoxin system Phd/YefM family antitoxin n=1 Tax=Nocardia cyriacigeorgica TaxID=135487 RepID=UPI0002DB0326|nr:type II toxin-antitoxin system prevent-host-death family antitoxin [Nocardia cyriacigeorgica]MBF6499066.1 type II toxin-antitoxin system prevent-host-death family antitoxin [Nocardia cyriacigeorgica]TLF52912.1 type II toxin-antitoxin system prevent-host-death family antitoxin [Nocardia cyriacigeorgica]